MLLVVTIDKDNDFGRKASALCPIIGEEAIWDAVKKFAYTDPEDSDLNAALVAVKLAKKKGGIPVIICGTSKKGSGTIEEIRREVKIVTEKTGTKKAIIITDGAEDDTLIPIISNDLEIIDVYHVAVKQLMGLEKTIYIIINYFKEFFWSNKTKNLTAVILSTLFLIYGLIKILGIWYPNITGYFTNMLLGSISIIISLYFLSIVFDGRSVNFEGGKVIRFAGYFTSTIILVIGVASSLYLQSVYDMLNRVFLSIFGSVLIFFLTKAIYYYFISTIKYKKYLYLSTMIPGMYGIINFITKIVIESKIESLDFGVLLLTIGISLLLFIGVRKLE